MTHVLPYGHFLTRVFKDVGVDLSRDGIWGPQHIWYLWWSVHGDDEIWEGPRWFLGEKVERAPTQTPLVLDHAPWMDLLLISTLLVLAWRSFLWLVTHISTPWRIVLISIRLASLHSLSISNRGLSILRIAWSVSMRRWWPICLLCFHLHLLSLDLL